MDATPYSVEDYVSDLRRVAGEAHDELELVERLRPFAVRLARATGWIKPEFRQCDPSQGFGLHLLHEEPDHALAVFVIAWLPDRGTLPHNHKTWALVVGLEGRERESLWRRIDDQSRPGFAELEHEGDRIVTAGDVSTCMPDDIHSVWNVGAEPSMSLHTYGRHINFTGRSEFDPVSHEERPMIVSVQKGLVNRIPAPPQT